MRAMNRWLVCLLFVVTGGISRGWAVETNLEADAESREAEEGDGLGWGPIVLGGAVVVGGVALAAGGGGGGGGGGNDGGGGGGTSGGGDGAGSTDDISFKGLIAANLWDGTCGDCVDAYSLNQAEFNAELSGKVEVDGDGHARIAQCKVTLKSDISPIGGDPSCPVLGAGTYTFHPNDASADLIIARARDGQDLAVGDGIVGTFSADTCDIEP